MDKEAHGATGFEHGTVAGVLWQKWTLGFATRSQTNFGPERVGKQPYFHLRSIAPSKTREGRVVNPTDQVSKILLAGHVLLVPVSPGKSINHAESAKAGCDASVANDRKPEPSTGDVIAFDLNTVRVHLGPVPIDEVLSFRRILPLTVAIAYLSANSQTNFCACLLASGQPLLSSGRPNFNEIANELRTIARKAWKKPASFALTLTGAAITLATGNPLPAAVGIGTAILGYQSPQMPNAGAYTYLFNAREQFAL